MSTRTAELLMAIGMLVFSLGLMWNIYSDGLVIGWCLSVAWLRCLAILVRYGAMFGWFVGLGHNPEESQSLALHRP